MNRAIVIKTVGDEKIAGAIVDGMTSRVISLNQNELALVKAELCKYKGRYELRAYGDEKRFIAVREELAEKYSTQPHGRAYNAILGVWGMLWLGFTEWVEYFKAWNRGV